MKHLLSKIMTLFAAGEIKKDIRKAIEFYGYPFKFDLDLLHPVLATLKDDEYAVLLVRQKPAEYVSDFDLWRINVKPSEGDFSADDITVEDVLGKGRGR